MSTIIFISMVILSKVHEHESRISIEKKEPYQTRVENSKDRINRDRLARIVEYLNGKVEVTQEQRLLENDEQDKYKVADVMKLLQKNYDTRADKDKEVPKVRVHVIENPEILKEYLRNLRKSHSSTSSDDSSSSSDSSDFDQGRDVRRNAEFRVDKEESNEIKEDNNLRSYYHSNINVRMDKNKHRSLEDQMTPFQIHTDNRNTKKGDFSKRNRDSSGRDHKRFKQRSKKRAENIDDTWDMITTNYNWKKEAKNDWNHEARGKKDWGEYNKDSFNDRSIKTTDWSEEHDIEYTTKKLVDRKRQSNRARKKKNNDDDSIQSNKGRSDKEIVSEIVSEPRMRHKWEEPKTKKKNLDLDWGNNSNNMKRELNDEWAGKEWSKSSKNTWDESGRTTRKSWKRVEKNKAVESYKPSYIARIPEYKKVGRERSESGFQGRTPIPFVGKKGIYEDK